MNREEIQSALVPVVASVLDDLGLDVAVLDPSHTRRTVRALLRLAAQVALRRDGCLGNFLALAVEAYGAEAQAQSEAPKSKAQA
jgi:hypothetical protein